MTHWVVVVTLGLATIMFKAAGPLLLGGRELSKWVREPLQLLAPTLLAALVVTQTIGDGDSVAFDARIVGLAAAGLALWRKLPTLVVVAAAATCTALVRAVTG